MQGNDDWSKGARLPQFLAVPATFSEKLLSNLSSCSTWQLKNWSTGSTRKRLGRETGGSFLLDPLLFVSAAALRPL